MGGSVMIGGHRGHETAGHRQAGHHQVHETIWTARPDLEARRHAEAT